MTRIENELTIYQAAAMKPQLMELLRTAGDIELDLSAVTEFDSAGYQLLVLIAREARKSGRTLRVTAQSGAVREVLELYGAAGAFSGEPAAAT